MQSVKMSKIKAPRKSNNIATTVHIPRELYLKILEYQAQTHRTSYSNAVVALISEKLNAVSNN